ncbi:hypothetical protein FOA52_006214 [Chlamydomonas sp. UWO 241]|nr:hypothetical protein FOA52_006214 [Chlamydomonas sp. UWO 241]
MALLLVLCAVVRSRGSAATGAAAIATGAARPNAWQHSQKQEDTLAAGRALLNERVLANAALPLMWSDEFDGASLKTSVWGMEIGDGSGVGLPGWGNNEQQCYTASPSNVAIVPDPSDPSNGLLQITVRQNPGWSCDNGAAPASVRNYTSARLHTRNSLGVRYSDNGTPVRVEARIKFPIADGLWPAFWMLPQQPNDYGLWCASGEIDILEHVNAATTVNATLHYGGIPGGGGFDAPDCVNKGSVTDLGPAVAGWHTYGVEWAPAYIAFSIDGAEWYRAESSEWYSGSAPDSETAPFDRPFHLILNLAAGGGLPERDQPGVQIAPGDHSLFVDWVRVYGVAPIVPAGGLALSPVPSPLSPAPRPSPLATRSPLPLLPTLMPA